MNTLTPQIIVAFFFALMFVTALMVLAIRFPNPTPLQYTLFRIVLALAAAGVAATIPGIIRVELSRTVGIMVRAVGLLAVFVVVFFHNPAALVRHKAGTPTLHELTRGEPDTGNGSTASAHGSFDNDREVVTATLSRILGSKLGTAVENLKY